MSLFSSLGSYLFGVPDVSNSQDEANAAQAQAAAQQQQGNNQAIYAGENGLASQINNTITGAAPSVAATQLAQSQDQNIRSGLAMGAGSTGANGVLARYLASQNTGNQAAANAQAGAILRAKEVSDAEGRLAGLYGNMGNTSASLYSANLQNGLGYNEDANKIAEANASRDQQAGAAVMQGISGIGSLATSFFKPTTAAAAPTAATGSALGSSDPAVSNAAWGSYTPSTPGLGTVTGLGSSNPATSNSAWDSYSPGNSSGLYDSYDPNSYGA
jgi:hypothetical protein